MTSKRAPPPTDARRKFSEFLRPSAGPRWWCCYCSYSRAPSGQGGERNLPPELTQHTGASRVTRRSTRASRFTGAHLTPPPLTYRVPRTRSAHKLSRGTCLSAEQSLHACAGGDRFLTTEQGTPKASESFGSSEPSSHINSWSVRVSHAADLCSRKGVSAPIRRLSGQRLRTTVRRPTRSRS